MAAPIQPPVAPGVGNTIPKRRLPLWLKVVLVVLGLGLVGIIAIIAVVYWLAIHVTAAPVDVSNRFINAVQAGQSSEAYALTGPSFRSATTEAQLAQVITTYGPALRGDEQIISRSAQSDTAASTTSTVTYRVQGPSGTRYMQTILESQGGTWTILNFETNDRPFETGK